VARRKRTYDIYRDDQLQFQTPYAVQLDERLLTSNEEGWLRLHGVRSSDTGGPC
jgi:hypothetical protein